MRHFLYIDSETRLEFSSRAKAFIYADKNNITSIVLTVYDKTMSVSHQYTVFNPYLVGCGCVEYFKTENQALKHIASFLN